MADNSKIPRERPILFQGAMVRATLADTKTQTRREITRLAGFGPITELQASDTKGYQWQFRDREKRWHDVLQARLLECCPYGQPGDRLYVREAWGYFDPDGSGEDYDRDHNDDGNAGPCKVYAPELMQEGHALRNYWRRRIAYKATWEDSRYGHGLDGPKRWRPSIHMPRWASRITLEITGVSVERLQAITEEDAKAEGVQACARRVVGLPGGCESHLCGYRQLWKQINGAGSWDANPWVWCITFRRIA